VIFLTSLVPLGLADLLLREQIDFITLEEMERVKRACDLLYDDRKNTENRAWIRDRDKLLITMLWSLVVV